MEAEKEGYILSKSGDKPGHFEARKLAELRLRVTDEAGKPLPGVLLSVSGGKDYRKNSLTGEGGIDGWLKYVWFSSYMRAMHDVGIADRML